MTVLIYQAYNLRNDKRYIGLTEKGIRARKMKHLANANRGQAGKFYTAIRKHGPDAFLFSELVTCEDYWHGLEVERMYISLLKPEYNLTEGGGGVKGFKFSDESRKKMSLAKKGRVGHPCPAWLKKKNSELRKAEKGAVKNYFKKKVYSKNDNLFFDSATAAAVHYGVSLQQISSWCLGRKSRRGIVVHYIEEQ